MSNAALAMERNGVRTRYLCSIERRPGLGNCTMNQSMGTEDRWKQRTSSRDWAFERPYGALSFRRLSSDSRLFALIEGIGCCKQARQMTFNISRTNGYVVLCVEHSL